MSEQEKQSALSRRAFLVKSGQALAGLLLLSACGSSPQPTSTPAPGEGATRVPDPTTSPTLPTVATPDVTSTVAATTPASVSLDVKIGQMILVGFRGLVLTPDNPIVQDLQERHIGGVVLFDYDVPGNSPVRNIQSPEQLQALTAALQMNATLPLLISVDQEGGQVVRLKEQFGSPPTVSEQYLGALDDPARTRQNAESIAQTLALVGINLNLAPVVDLNTNPDNPIIGRLERSFSADPDIVTRNALEEIQAHHRSGVLTTLKHFPGHGSSRSDSHLGFVDVTDTWSQTELAPYARLIAGGECDAVMTAHVFNRKLDPNLPATLSQPTITGILRDQLHFDGVVLSDDMQMGAISQNYGLTTAVEAAINAGVDILSIANNTLSGFDPNIAAHVIDIIRGLIENGRIAESRIDESFRRIMRLKARLG